MTTAGVQAAPKAAGRVGDPRLFWAPILVLDLLLLAFLGYMHLVALLALSLAVLLALFRRPRLALALSVFGAPLFDPIYQIFRTEIPAYALARLLVLAPLTVWAWDRLWFWPGERSRRMATGLGGSPILWWSAALGVVLALTSIWTPAPSYALFKAGTYFADNLVILAAACVFLRSHDRGEQVARGFRFLSALLGVELLIGCAAVWNFFTRFYPFTTRLVTLGANPVFLGREAVVGLLALIALAAARRVRLVLVLPAAGLLLWVLYSTGSRGPILGLAMASAFLIATSAGKWGRRLRPVFILLLLGGAVFMVFYLPSLVGQAVAPLADREGSNAMRMLMLRTAWGSIVETWPWGLGTGGFPALLKLGDVRFFPHNIYAEVLLENGLLGIVVLLGLTAAVVRQWIFARRRAVLLAVSSDEALLLRTSGAMLIFSLVMAGTAGDLLTNDLLWLWSGALLAWGRWGREGARGEAAG